MSSVQPMMKPLSMAKRWKECTAANMAKLGGRTVGDGVRVKAELVLVAQ